MPANKDANPLALSDTLRDLAILRASDIDLAGLLASIPGVAPSASQTIGRPQILDDTERGVLINKSYTFVSEAKAAMKIMNSGMVDNQGARIEEVRAGLKEVVKGLGDESDEGL